MKHFVSAKLCALPVLEVGARTNLDASISTPLLLAPNPSLQ
jgi:hypothetical protein